MNLLEGILEYYPEEEILKANGFDSAVIGIEVNTMRLIYSSTKIIETLIEKDEMTLEEAIEHYEYNILGSYVGEKTPIHCDDMYLI
jgi:hypothetical protein